MVKWVDGKIIKIIHWNEYLFSIILRAPINNFIPGQYSKIKMLINGKYIQRAYSYVNAPDNKNIEFYLVHVKSGKLSSYLYNLKPDDKLMLTKESYGYFTLDKIPICENLWMLATGTAIGPYLSILQSYHYKLNNFKKIILVYAVRFYKDLSYLTLINNLQKTYNNKLIVQTIISREKETENILQGRIPNLILNKKIENKIGINIDYLTSHVMICGNPNMVKETQNILQKNRKMIKNSVSQIGHFTTENYW